MIAAFGEGCNANGGWHSSRKPNPLKGCPRGSAALCVGSPFKGLGILEPLATASDAEPGIPAAVLSPQLVAALGRSVGRSWGSSPPAYSCRQALRAAFWGVKWQFGALGGQCT